MYRDCFLELASAVDYILLVFRQIGTRQTVFQQNVSRQVEFRTIRPHQTRFR